MSSTELLNATLKAIGNKDLFAQYEELLKSQEQKNILKSVFIIFFFFFFFFFFSS